NPIPDEILVIFRNVNMNTPGYPVEVVSSEG
ncbi:unnamed protein product, partial [marine sediment metagenome]